MSLIIPGSISLAQIPEPTDAPQPRSPEESAAAFVLPDGFRMEVIASEPLISSPSGVCWDERGRMFVSELHGYNLEGQLDIEELNKTGQLDTQVRRVQAEEKFKEAAKGGTFGVIKMLSDTDGDGRMDDAVVWASDLPPAYGLVPARGGVIVACAPDIVYLADQDGDGVAEIRETLFTGFRTGALERGINAPQWNVDGWIYFGRGWGGSEISGPKLRQPIALPDSNFRIRADGSAIEPVTGGTHTFGFAMTESGDRFVVNTTIPAIYVAPLPWRYLIRNSDAAVSDIEVATGDRRAWSLAPPHPWRQRRADDPEYFKFYNSRYGAAESEADGWFTAACSPLIYEDYDLPGLHGTYLVCEPSGNLIHRAEIIQNGSVLEVHRFESEAKSEFAATHDPWCHPINLHHAPDGTIAIVDYYREIIEDYSAIPRHLQQQYGVYHGADRGRVYRLTHKNPEWSPVADMRRLNALSLAGEATSSRYWRRQTAQRLLVERGEMEVVQTFQEVLADDDAEPSTIISLLHTLNQLGALQPADVIPQLAHSSDAVRIHALQLSDRWFPTDVTVLEAALAAAEAEQNPRVLLQFAMSLGESRDSRAFAMLVRFAREHSQTRWMDAALMSSLAGRAGLMFAALIDDPEKNSGLLDQLAGAISARGDQAERTLALGMLANVPEPRYSELRGALSRVHEASPDEIEAFTPSKEKAAMEVSDETFRQYTAALSGPRDLKQGHAVFTRLCSACHQIGREGHVVGPDLLGELAVAEETLIRHILLPNERIRPGFETVLLELNDGRFATGLLKDDGATSVTLLAPGGITSTFLRKDIAAIHRRGLSLMPSFAAAITPADTSNLIGWLRSQLRTVPK